ncbi:hypothetical protein GCM10027176_25730 [Actinoallomurus bryophytorum]
MEETRDGDAAALDEDPAEATLGEHVQQAPRLEAVLAAGDLDDLDAVDGVLGGTPALGQDPQGRCGAVGEEPPPPQDAAAMVQQHTHRVGARAGAYGQPRVVGDGGPGADDDRVGECAEPVQVKTVLLARDVDRVAGTGRDEAVHALAELGEHVTRTAQAQGNVEFGEVFGLGRGVVLPPPRAVLAADEPGLPGVPLGPYAEQPLPCLCGAEYVAGLAVDSHLAASRRCPEARVDGRSV